MSGIVGIFGKQDRPAEKETLARMLFLLEPQGPDEQAYWTGGPVALGHTLLKTTRESENEVQPSTLDGDIWMTADARIDGRPELIAELRGKGIALDQSVTDDHLILHAYALWGQDCLDHLIGDFAFILWDERRRQLFCATDHMGVSPLYYAQVQDGFLFSNNVKAIRAHPQISENLNEQAIGDYILFRMNHKPDSTSFSDIHKLPSGHKIIVTDDKLQIARYWSAPKPEYIRRSKEEYVEQFRALFKTAVADRLRTDGAGTHLSGGMDSTSIAAMLAELKSDGVTTHVQSYNQGSKIEALNLEKPLAEKTAKKLGIPLHIYFGGEDALEPDIDDMADMPPEPSFTKRSIARFDLLSHSLKTSRTFYAGYGGDPLLWPDYRYWSQLRRSGKLATHIADGWRHFQLHGKLPRAMIPQMLARKRKVTAARTPLPSWLDEGFEKRNDLMDRYHSRAGAASVNLDAREGLADDPLWRRVFEWQSPAYSGLPMKVRLPFFDIRLLSWAQTVPPYPWLHHKFLLRTIMQDALPQEVLSRRKTTMPDNVLRTAIETGSMAPTLEGIKTSRELGQFIDISRFLNRISDPNNLTNADTKSMVRLNSLAHWLENYKKLGNFLEKSDAKITRYKNRRSKRI